MKREMKGVTRTDRIKKEHIRGSRATRFGDKVRETRLRWLGIIKRRDGENIDERMLEEQLPGKRKRRRLFWIRRMEMKLIIKSVHQ